MTSTYSKTREKRRLTEEELRQSEELYRTVVAAMAEGVVVQERDGTITACNKSAQRILGLTHDQILGRTSVDPRWQAVYEDRSPFPGEKHPSMVALTTGKPVSNVCMGLQRSKNDTTWILINAEPVFYPGTQEPRGVVTTFTDITDRKRLEEQLSHAQRLEGIGRLAGGVAHDFNNVLGIILGHCDLMAEKLPPDERIAVHTKAIRKSADHAAALTRQLLAFSRKQIMQMQRLNLNETVRNLMEMLKRLIGEHIELTAHLEPELGQVNVDPVQIEQVVMNLVVNARDAMPNGGRIVISTANVDLGSPLLVNSKPVPAGSYAMVSVSDTGHGMDEDTISHVFEPFYTTKEMGRGTGLGLSIIYGIVRQSNGHIHIDSEPGKGSIFKIYLPRVESTAEEIRIPEAAETGTGEPGTILLVDDDPDLREMVSSMLASSGYTILTASSAVEAVAFEEHYAGPIHLILTDMSLDGGEDGQELSRKIKAKRPDIKILLMSGYTESFVRGESPAIKGAAFLEKPFSSQQLRRKILQILNKSS